jgi:hypothetical protein
LALKLIADTHAAVAINALRHVHTNIWIRFVDEIRQAGVRAFSFKAIRVEESMELLVWELAHAIGRILLSEKSEQGSATFF